MFYLTMGKLSFMKEIGTKNHNKLHAEAIDRHSSYNGVGGWRV